MLLDANLSDQKAFLAAAKTALAPVGKKLTWDQFAALVGVESRAMKTYRMPADSSDYRKMPKLLIEKIGALVRETSKPDDLSLPAPPPVAAHSGPRATTL